MKKLLLTIKLNIMRKLLFAGLALLAMACTKEIEVEVPVVNPVNTQLQQQVQQLTNQISTLISTQESTQGNLDAAQAALEVLTEDKAELQSEYDQLASDYADITDELTEALSHIDELTAQLESGAGDVEALVVEIESLKDLVDALNAQISSLQNRIAQLESELANFNEAAREAAARSKLASAGFNYRENYYGSNFWFHRWISGDPTRNYYITTIGWTTFAASVAVPGGDDYIVLTTGGSVEEAIEAIDSHLSENPVTTHPCGVNGAGQTLQDRVDYVTGVVNGDEYHVEAYMCQVIGVSTYLNPVTGQPAGFKLWINWQFGSSLQGYQPIFLSIEDAVSSGRRTIDSAG